MSDQTVGWGECISPDGRWRVFHRGRAGIQYEELHQGEWRSLEIGGDILLGTASFVIYFGPVAAWENAPGWAQGRRGEIISRIKSAMPIPRYEYAGEEVMDDQDWSLLIEAAGGLSSATCLWEGCSRSALKSKRTCVRHAHPQLS